MHSASQLVHLVQKKNLRIEIYKAVYQQIKAHQIQYYVQSYLVTSTLHKEASLKSTISTLV